MTDWLSLHRAGRVRLAVDVLEPVNDLVQDSRWAPGLQLGSYQLARNLVLTSPNLVPLCVTIQRLP